MNYTVTPEGWIEVPIDDDMVALAQIMADSIPPLRNSITSGKGKVAGCLGEIAVALATGGDSENTYHHDVLVNGVRLEVKSKDRTVRPRPYYEASLCGANTEQQADAYVFTSVTRGNEGRYHTVYILGMLDPDSYKRRAQFLRVGDFDPSNGWVVKKECYNLRYDQLTSMASIIDG